MPQSPEEKKEYLKQYYQKNKDKINARQKEWHKNNKDKINARQKEYDKNHKEQKKEYRQTPKGKKIIRIRNWKYQGIITDDYDQLYNHYLKTAYCDACKVELTYGRPSTATTKCVDHDHSITDAPNFRNILCNACNVKRR